MDCIDPDDTDSGTYLHRLGRKLEAAGIPMKATMELTERCNLRCVHCYLGEQDGLGARRRDELSTARWIEMIDEIADMGSLYLLITGGEPLLRKDFAPIYTHAKRRGLLVTVFTNGTLVTDAILELFRTLPPYMVDVSLYGASEETYGRVTGRPELFQRCLSGIEALRGAGVDLRLKTVLMQQNQHEFDRIADLCRRNSTDGKFRATFEVHACLDGEQGPVDVRLDPAEGVRVQLSQADHAAVWADYYARRRAQTPAQSDRLYNCGAGWGQFHLDPYGRMQPCLTARYFNVDVRDGRLSDGLASIRRQLAATKAEPESDCATCAERMVCSSCPAHAYLANGNEAGKSDYHCRVARARSRQLLDRA